MNYRYFFIILISVTILNNFLNAYELEMNKHKAVVDLIIRNSISDSSAWERMAYLCDMFGHRLSGSQNLEEAIDWIKSEMIKDGFVNVRKEPVKVTFWRRGNEFCEMIEPRFHKIPIKAYGGSIGTPAAGITAPVLVVRSFEELEQKKNEAKGKIVVYNQPFISYGQSVQFRFIGAIKAAEVGAVASLCRAVSPLSHGHPHTGMMIYADTVNKIPHASISAEDAMLLDRMQKRGITPVLNLYMEAETLPDAISHNLIGEIRGSEFPNEIIAIGGHIDSWDVGSGAHDDAGGVVAVWQAAKLLLKLGLKPKHTIRLVFWTNEENGIMGGEKYAEKYRNEPHVLMFEFDSGVFSPSQIRLTAPDSIRKIYNEYEPLFKSIDEISIMGNGGGVDISPMMKLGVPGMSLNTNDQGKYFWYHHSDKDTPDKIDPKDMNKCVAAIALAIYLYDNMPIKLPSQFENQSFISR